MNRHTSSWLGRVVTAATVAALVGACASGGSTPSQTKALVIGYVTKSATNQGWILINAGAADAAKAAGAQLVSVGPAQAESLTGQLSAIEDMVNRHVNALAIAPVDSAGVAPAVQKALDAHIPVVAIDTAVTGANVTSFVATDNLKAAGIQGNWVAQHISDDGSLILVNGQISQSTGRDRHDGFLQALKAAKPKVTIYEVQTNWDQTQAQNGVEALLIAHSNVSFIVNAWDGGTMGAIAALKARNSTAGKVSVVGFDGAPNALQAMEQNWVQADVAQMLYQQGYKGIQTAIAAAQGKTVDARVDTGTGLVTPDNVKQFIIDNHLQQFMQ